MKLLIRLECLNLFGWNVWRHSKDRGYRVRQAALFGIILLLLCLAAAQMGAQVWAAWSLGAVRLAQSLPVFSVGALIFLFRLFDRSLFSRAGYEQLCSLPIAANDLALSRLVRLYLTALLPGIGVILPGLGLYAWLTRPDTSWYVRCFLGLPLLPLLPMGAACLLNTASTALLGRSHHPAALSVLLNLFWTVLLFLLPNLSTLSLLTRLNGPEDLFLGIELCMTEALPAWLLGWTDSWRLFAVYALCSIVLAAVASAVICRVFPTLTLRTIPKKSALARSSVLSAHQSITAALWKKEARQYFSCPVYVSNTMMGPLLAAAVSALTFLDLGPLEAVLPVSPARLAPFVWCAVCCTMCPAAVSLSMEGSRIWMLRSLPLSASVILDAKLLWTLSLMLPSYLISVPLLLLGLRPGWTETLWMILFPPVLCPLAAVFAVGCDLRFHRFGWTTAEEIVKQSLSSLTGGLIPSLLFLGCAGISAAVPAGWMPPVMWFCAAALTVLLYRKIRKADLLR